MPITLKDIADRTGVSPSVVSTVLSGRDNGTFVSKDTRERVLRVAHELNYTPVRSGRPRGSRRLRRQRIDQFVGVWSPELDAYAASVLSALQSAIYVYATEHAEEAENEYDFGLRLITEDDLPRLDMLGVVGLIVVGDVALPRVAAAASTPTVLIGEIDQPPSEFVIVHMDNFAAGRAVGEHLWQVGHRRIAFIAPSSKPRVTRQRWQGLQSVWVEHGASAEGCVPAPYDTNRASTISEQVHITVRSLFLPGKVAPSAIVAFNETIAVYATQALRNIDKVVPKDVSLICFGDTPNAAEAQPSPLTTVRPPLKQLAATAVAQLYNLARESELDGPVHLGTTARDLAFPGELMVRDSVTPPGL